MALTALGCQGADIETEQPPAQVAQASFELSSISCSESSDTGYKSGSPFAITVVTVDGKKVERDTANAYYVMAQAAAKAGVNIKVVSGFRTNGQQTYLYNCYKNCNCNNCNLAARPGYSNHQSGHALDLNTSSSGVYSWLSNHAASFGFKRTVPSEKWHWEWWGGGPGGGPCGKSPHCPASGKTKVCVDASKIGSCDDGKISVGDCGAFGAYCSTAGASEARCVSVFCVSDPKQQPKAHDVCLPGEKLGRCNGDGALASLDPCAADEKCVISGGVGRCEGPKPPAGDAGASADVLDDSASAPDAELSGPTLPTAPDSGVGVGQGGDSAASTTARQLRGAGCNVGADSTSASGAPAPPAGVTLTLALLLFSCAWRRRRRRRRRRGQR